MTQAITNEQAGWHEPLPKLALLGLYEFNAGQYFEQHEHLEAAWRAEPRPVRALYQGILQVGLAFLQIERNNWPGAMKMFRRSLPRLNQLPSPCQGVQLAPLCAAAETIYNEIAELGPDRLHEFDSRRFPRIEFEDRNQESGIRNQAWTRCVLPDS